MNASTPFLYDAYPQHASTRPRPDERGYPSPGQTAAPLRGLLVAAENQEPLRREEAFERIGRPPPDLHHPGVSWALVVPAVSIHRAASSITKKTQILIRPRGANTSTLKKKSAAPADDLTSHREPSPLHDGQSHSSPTQLPLEGGVLLAQVLDGRLMLAGDPAGHGGHEYLPGFENGAHPKPVGDARMNRQRSLRPGSGLN